MGLIICSIAYSRHRRFSTAGGDNILSGHICMENSFLSSDGNIGGHARAPCPLVISPVAIAMYTRMIKN